MKIGPFIIARAGRSTPERRDYTQDLLAMRAQVLQGGTVTQLSALGVSAVWACVTVIQNNLSILPIEAKERGPDGSVRDATGHPLAQMFATDPNNYQSWSVFIKLMVSHLLLWGNFYAEVQRDRRTGEALGLYPVHPSEVSVYLENGVKTYRVRDQIMADRDIFHLMGHSFDGLRGLPPLFLHRASISTSINQNAFGEKFWQNGARPAGALSHPSALTDQARTALRTEWRDKYGGSDNAGNVLVLTEGMRFDPITMPMEDAQFVETKHMQVAEAARIFGVPLNKLAALDGAKFNNVEQQNIAFVNDTLLPIAVAFEQETGRKLIADTERARLFVKIDFDELLRGDIRTRMAAYQIQRQWGLRTINEIRAREGDNPDDDERADSLFVGGNAQNTTTTNLTADQFDQLQDDGPDADVDPQNDDDEGISNVANKA